ACDSLVGRHSPSFPSKHYRMSYIGGLEGEKWDVPSGDLPRKYPVGLSSHWCKGCLGGVCPKSALVVGPRPRPLGAAKIPGGLCVTPRCISWAMSRSYDQKNGETSGRNASRSS